ncbi:hypothetical protein ACIBH1_09645 [Nonomuraea sp. NPDC050663]|uniref:hypothetical protein n=1 Tax=Nonomuraea sp. NPDC050663 TaxID=3364370 RepID=UPI00378F5106
MTMPLSVPSAMPASAPPPATPTARSGTSLPGTTLPGTTLPGTTLPATSLPGACAASGVSGLVAELSRVNAEQLLDRMARAAAAVTGAGCAGFVEVDPLQDCAWPVRVHVPPGDPQRVRRWLAESGALKTLATACGAVRLAADPEFGEPGFLAVPMPLATHAQAYLWVAGRAFDDIDEHLLGRFATAAGRALEGARSLEAAARMLRAVQAFR